MAARPSLSFVLSTLIAALVVGTVADASYTYTEGIFNQGDAVFVNCTYNVKGTYGSIKVVDVPMTMDAAGAKITYINVQNYKPIYQQATIAKTDGGAGASFVKFHLVSVEGHGFLFHFEVRGTTPPGTKESANIGDCTK